MLRLLYIPCSTCKYVQYKTIYVVPFLPKLGSKKHIKGVKKPKKNDIIDSA